jgi:hypothetical protein
MVAFDGKNIQVSWKAEPRVLKIDALSSAVIRLKLLFQETHLGVGTGFFWQRAGEIFLVTNWHNVSGRNPETNKHISETLAEPDALEIMLPASRLSLIRQPKRIPLYKDDEPLWLEHPFHRKNVDVVAVPTDIDPAMVLAVNDLTPATDLTAEVGKEVFILGFPRGVGVKDFPLWKRASIASEPEFDVDDLPLFYVDTASSKGMSGSPVVLRTLLSAATTGTLLGAQPMLKFMGVYSGRLASETPLDAQIGKVWKASVISEILCPRIEKYRFLLNTTASLNVDGIFVHVGGATPEHSPET